ncbi:MAG: hypothetical protein BWK76_27750 [Desulfobulbaceae bacterium A2]|nr:MAG: hypothetical protein BWK76_27750 [Desulfobulbaceae bacterium A2]
MTADASVRPSASSRPPAPAPPGATLKYNPHLWGDDELRAIFVVRRRELAELLDCLRQIAPDSVPQHILITGLRGMGKSTLLRRIALAVRDDTELSRNWLALSFPEEQYTVSTLAEFWRNVLDALADSLERQGCPPGELTGLDAAIAAIETQPADRREAAALTLLRQTIGQHQRRVLLLIDSSDLLLASLAGADSRGAAAKASATPLWRLRKTLSHEPGIFWLGASYQALESEHQYHNAFHDFFRLVELRPLGLDEMREAMLALARTFGMAGVQPGEEAAASMARSLDARPERLRALRAMTGGNPRTTVMLYDLFAAGADSGVHSDLNSLLDTMTPLYKARMEGLAEQPRKILAHLMELWAPASARDLARAAALPVTTVSGQLHRLEAEGLVERVRLAGSKRNGYQTAERFFNVWYLMRSASRRQRQRLGWMVEFMRLWYSAEELTGLADSRAALHRSGRCCDESGLDYSRALAAALPEGCGERCRLEWAVFAAARDTRRALRELFDLDGDDHQFIAAEEYLARFQALDAALARCPHAAGDMDAWIDAVKGAPFLDLAEKEKIATAENSSRDDFEEGFNLFKISYQLMAGCFGDSVAQSMRRAVREGRFFPDCPDSKLAYGQLMAEFGDDPAAFRFGTELLAEHHQDIWLEKAYRRAIELDGKNANLWKNLGNLLAQHLYRFEEAESAYRHAISLDEKNSNYWDIVGDLLKDRLGRYEEAESAYRRAIELDEKCPVPWSGLGDLLQDHLGRHEEAESAYRRAIELDGKYAVPWNGLGNLLRKHLGRYEEAESAYRHAIELHRQYTYPVITYPVINLVCLLERQERKDEAVEFLRLMVKLAQEDDDQHLVLLAQLWLGNVDAARLALEGLARQAAAGDSRAFYRLREQTRDCHQLGLGEALASLMEECLYAEFLRPLSLALRAAGPAGVDILASAPPEMAQLAAEVRDEIIAAAPRRQQ